MIVSTPTDYQVFNATVNMTIPPSPPVLVQTVNGWIMIQQKLDESFSFNRSWTEFQVGHQIDTHRTLTTFSACIRLNAIVLCYLPFMMNSGSRFVFLQINQAAGSTLPTFLRFVLLEWGGTFITVNNSLFQISLFYLWRGGHSPTMIIIIIIIGLTLSFSFITLVMILKLAIKTIHHKRDADWTSGYYHSSQAWWFTAPNCKQFCCIRIKTNLLAVNGNVIGQRFLHPMKFQGKF